MGLQVSCGVDTEIQKERSVLGTATRTGRGIQGIGQAKGEQGRRRASTAGSFAHDGNDTAEIFGSAGGGVHKGEKCDTYCTTYMNRRKNFMGENFWARGYYVSTVGKDEEVVRRYIQQQEADDRRIDQLRLFE
jgi:putative transposase